MSFCEPRSCITHLSSLRPLGLPTYAERTGCVFAESNGYYPAAGYINIMSASGSGGGAEAGTSGYCWSASSAGKNGYALTYSVSAIKTEAEPSKTWACPVRCVKDVK